MPKKKILLVDDEETFTQLVRMNLETTGKYEVKIENSGSQALATAMDFHPDLIFLDIIMPDMDGSDLAQQIRTVDALKDVPIIFLTAVVTSEEVDKSTGVIGGESFLAKPVNARQIIESIEEHIGSSR